MNCVSCEKRARRLWIESNKLVTMPSRNVNMWMSIMCAARCVERNLMMGRRGKWNGHPICWLFAMLWITIRQQRASSWFFLFFGSGTRRKECEIYIHYRGGFMCVSHLSSYIRWKKKHKKWNVHIWMWISANFLDVCGVMSSSEKPLTEEEIEKNGRRWGWRDETRVSW